MNKIFKSTQIGLLIILVFSGFLLFFRLGDRSFRNPDEGRYAEAAREMAQSKDWVKPTLYGVDYLSKPILFYWLVALSFKVFGFTELAARSVPAFFAWFGVLVTFLFTRKILGVKEAFATTLILTTNIWYLAVGRYLVIDSVFTFFVMASFYAFYIAITQADSSKIYFRLFYMSIALAFLTKGLAGVVVPGFCIFIYLVFARRFKEVLSQMRLIEGIAIFLAVTLPWFVLISLREPGFLNQFFIHEHFKRFISKDFEHQEGWYFYWVIALLIFFPWVLFWGKLKEAFSFHFYQKNLKSPQAYLSIVALGVIIFFSLSKSKLATYILPITPLLSIVLGSAWSSSNNASEAKAKTDQKIVVGFLVLAVVAFTVSFFWVPAFKKLTPLTWRYFQGMCFAIIFQLSSTLLFLNKRNLSKVFYINVIFMSLFSILLSGAINSANDNYTTRSFAQKLKPSLQPGDLVFIYDQPGAFYDFAFYLDFPVRLVGLEGELKLSADDKHYGDQVISKSDFNRMAKIKMFYCLMRKSDYQELSNDVRAHFSPIREDSRRILVQSTPGSLAK